MSAEDLFAMAAQEPSQDAKDCVALVIANTPADDLLRTLRGLRWVAEQSGDYDLAAAFNEAVKVVRRG